MATICPICHDCLFPSQIEVNEPKITAAECGHMFHRACLRQWLEQGTQSATKCPCCRKTVIISKCLSLFPTHNDVQILHTASVEENNIELNETLSKLKKENQLQRVKIEELVNQLQVAEDMKDRIKLSCQIWIKRSEKLDAYKVENNNLKARCETLEMTLKQLHKTGIISSCEITNHATENFKECCTKTSESLSFVNEVLTKELLEARNRIKLLEESLKQTKSSYVDVQFQLQEFLGL